MIATNEPKVAGYLPPSVYDIPQSVYDQLTAFKEKRGLESVEMAVTVILEEYFGFTQTPIPSGADATTSRLETLEAKCIRLAETVAELQTAIATIQASGNQSVGYQETPLHQHSSLPLQDKGAAAESINSPAVDQGGSLELAAINHSQMTESELGQLSMNETLSDPLSVNNLSVEDTEALKLTRAIVSTSGSKDIELELPLLRTRAIKP